MRNFVAPTDMSREELEEWKRLKTAHTEALRLANAKAVEAEQLRRQAKAAEDIATEAREEAQAILLGVDALLSGSTPQAPEPHAAPPAATAPIASSGSRAPVGITRTGSAEDMAPRRG